MSKPMDRQLLPEEARAIALVRRFERMANDNNKIVRLVFSPEKLIGLSKDRIRATSVVYDRKSGDYVVTLDIVQFARYAHTFAKQHGLTVALDGDIKTHDGFIINPKDKL